MLQYDELLYVKDDVMLYEMLLNDELLLWNDELLLHGWYGYDELQQKNEENDETLRNGKQKQIMFTNDETSHVRWRNQRMWWQENWMPNESRNLPNKDHRLSNQENLPNDIEHRRKYVRRQKDLRQERLKIFLNIFLLWE